MPEIVVSDLTREIKIESEVYLDAVGTIVRRLVDLLIVFEGKVQGLQELKFEALGEGLYRYEFTVTSEGGRSWEQEIEIPATGDASMDFEVPEKWSEAEFAPHRAIRETLIGLARSHRVTLLTVEW